jgi:hypothetical protein
MSREVRADPLPSMNERTIGGVIAAYPYALDVMDRTLLICMRSSSDAAEYVSKEVNNMTYDQLGAFAMVASAAACASAELLRKEMESK